MSRNRLRRTVMVLALLLASAAYARTESQPKVVAGPTVITPDEQLRVADPAAGVADAVILLEETKRVETSAGRAKVWYHVRAKVLSEAGLALAAIDIPDVVEGTKLQKWWGHVMLPSGEAFTLPQEKLDDTIDPVTGERSITGKFSRAVPGCVIDWGYVVTGARLAAFEVVPLQRAWRVDRLLYRWRRIGSTQDGGAVGGFQLERPVAGMGVERDKQGALLHAERLPPALGAARPATLVLWALHPVFVPQGELVDLTKIQEKFWNDRARRIENEAADFAGNPERLRAAMQAILFAASADFQERLRFAYDWIDANVKTRPSKWTATPGIAVGKTRGRAHKVLVDRTGAGIDRTLTFLSVARALGADAALVLTTDPRDWTWDRSMLLVEQFSHALVEVRAADGRIDFVAVGSGLPYGQVPEGLSRSKALRLTSRGVERIEIP